MFFNELNYDRYAADSKDIYRVKLSSVGNGDIADYPNVDFGVGPGIKKALPEVISFTRLTQAGPVFVKYEEIQFKEQHVAYADSNFLQLFSIPLLEGDLPTALKDPNSIIISKSFEKKYFGNSEALGKSLSIGKKGPFKITGVFDQIPENSHFHFDAFISFSTLPGIRPTWSNIGFYTYLKLNEHTDPKKMEAKFPELVAKYVVPEIQHDMGVSLAEAQKSVGTFLFSLEPLRDIHLRSNTKYELEPNGDIHYVYIFTALAIFILLLACINFTNLSTASAAKRSREVGIRKVMGSLKKQLVFQFLTESVLLTLLATICAYLFVFLLLPYFNHISGKNISFLLFLKFSSLSVILIFSILVGMLAGIYPSFFLSSFNTIKILKGSSSVGSGKNMLRNGLVVFQFFVSITLIIATIIVFQQLHYMQNKKLGYDKDQVLYLPDAYLLGNTQNAFKEDLINDPRVLSASIARSVPGSINMDGTEIFPKNEKGNGVEIHSNIYHIDYDFLHTLNIPVLQGRNFSKDYPTDSSAVLINVAAAQQLGWSGLNPLGRTIVRSGQKEFKVVGVVADFHYASLKQKIAPLMMLLGNNDGGLIIKLKTGDIKSYIGDLTNKWNSYHPDGALTYQFLDENFASLYAAEQSTSQIFTSFTILAIVIASLGLFGLAAFVTEQRTREIGIRKVLGASIRQLLVLVTKDFLYLVGLAFVLSIPFTWWAMNSWLNDFAYRIKIEIWVFPLSGLAAICIALLTISFRAVKASVANPVDSLKTL